MSDTQASGQAERFEVRVSADSHLAWLRTRLAVERTMMAYMRTSVALIGCGGYAAIAGVASEQKKTPLYGVAGVLIVIGTFAFFAVLLRFS